MALALVAWNTLANRTTWFHRVYVPANLVVTGLTLAAAKGAGLPPAALGLDPRNVGEGMRVGGAAAAAVAALLGAAFVAPRSRRWFRDGRVAGLDGRRVGWWATVEVPFGTVVLEEVAFRGVLLASWRTRLTTPAAVAASSLAFGAWHVSPTLDALTANGVTAPRARLEGVAAAVAATSLVGSGLCWLRLVSGSLVAPALAHTAANSLALLAAHTAHRLGEPTR